jgi:hypothetical protein
MIVITMVRRGSLIDAISGFPIQIANDVALARGVDISLIIYKMASSRRAPGHTVE